MIKVTTVEEMVAIEKATDAAGVSYDEMMENAGRGVADVILDLVDRNMEGGRVVVLVGPGNNGGDGLVAARLLAQESELEVSCYLLKSRGDDDANYVSAHEAGVFMANAEDDQRWRVLKNLVASADVVVDALLGTGARLPIDGDLKKLMTHTAAALSERRSIGKGALQAPGAPGLEMGLSTIIVAVDCPSGLDCDTGESDSVAIPADVTVTFAAAKAGQLRFPGAEAVGELVVADIGVPDRLKELEGVSLEMAAPADIYASLPARPSDGHKGTFGRVVVVAGSINYTGAAYLAGLSAYRVGAGLVTMAVPQPIYPMLASLLPEATWLLLPHDMGVLNNASAEVYYEEVGAAEALLLGPGLGREPETAAFLRTFLRAEVHDKRGTLGFITGDGADVSSEEGEEPSLPPLVIDADGLNLLAEIEEWWKLLSAETILTPHPGEMARLTGLERDEILADRVGVAGKFAQQWDCVVVLKGAFTVVATPDGRTIVQPFATAALAKAGTGDVLAGAIGGLLAQGMSPPDAAIAGAYLHGLAGKLAGELTESPRSLLAGDVADALGAAFRQLEA